LGVKSRLSRGARTLNREAFKELNHDLARSMLVLGGGRSGTTWLAEVLARHSSSRLLFEPFHPLWCPRPDDLRLFMDPDDLDPRMESLADHALSGRLRKFQVDQVVISRLPRSRIVKDIHSTNLLPWYVARYPEVPVAFVVRHPIASALSRQRFGSFYGLAAYLGTATGRRDAERSPTAGWLPVFDSYSSHPEPLVRLVAEWCIENAYPLSHLDGTRVALTFYETAVLDPVSELARINDLSDAALGTSGRDRVGLESTREPSTKDWFGTVSAARTEADWTEILTRWTKEVPRATIKACVEVLADFGIDSVYGEDPMPLRAVVG
jgi:hypothetical protein